MNIQAIARRTGVPAATLRKWEQRYGVLTPTRTAGAHRRYSERDIVRVEWLKARLAEGYRIGEAARLIGGAHGPVPTDPAVLVDELVGGSVVGDAGRVARALAQTFEVYALAQAVTDVAEPALRRMGELWRSGRASVAHEHCLTELTRAKLRGLLDDGHVGTRGLAVLCCVEGERHDCGLLALAVLLHADGWGIVYLGADTPVAEAADLAHAGGARVLCVSGTLHAHARAAERELAKVADRYRDLVVVRGGAEFGGEPAPRAVQRVRELAAA